MSTVSPLCSSGAATSNQSKCLSFLKSQPRAYSPWREAMSVRQINAYFERQILPELSVLLDGAFRELPDSDREEAVQDSVCQALEAFRALRLYENSRQGTVQDETALVLAKFASSRYLAGVRFANPRSKPRL